MKMTREERMREYEDLLLKQEGRLRRSRLYAVILIALFLMVGILGSYYPHSPSVSEQSIRIGTGINILCILLMYQYYLKLKHIDSIKYYRGMSGGQPCAID